MKTKSFFEQINQGSTSVWIAAAAVVVVWGLVALMLIAGVFLYLERPTLAQQPPSNVAVAAIAVQPTTAGAGSPLAVSGQGWTPGSLVSIYLLPPGQTQTPNFATAQATANAQGSFTASVAIPSGTEWQTTGTATVIARLAAGGTSAQTTFNLSAAPQAATPTPTPTETATPALAETPTVIATGTGGSTTPLATSKINLNIRSGPGTNFPVIGVLLAGQSADISGVSADGGWWEIAFPGGPNGVGWVSAPFVTAQNTSNVPVVAAPPVPPPTPTPLPVAQPPVAVISGPGQAGQNVSITFSGTGSTASAGHNITGFVWSFGDGTTGNGSSVSHVYGSTGTFIVSLTVTDDLGQTANATLTIQITAQGPTAQFDAPKEASIGQSVEFDAGDSHAASGHSIVDYDWNFNDGNSGSGSQPDHTFNEAGTFDVRLRVTDDQGLTSEVRHHITIEGLPTAAISGPTQALVGQSLGFSGSSSDDDIVSFNWNFGDGGSASGQNVSHIYSQSGNFVVTLTVTDDEGSSATAAQVVSVNSPGTATPTPTSTPVPPTATPTPTSTSVPATATPTPTSTSVPTTATPTPTSTSVPATATPTPTSTPVTPTATPVPTAVLAQAPHAVISGPGSGTVGESVSFSAESSTVGAGSKKFNTVTWNFGDGGTASGAKVSHIYHKAGTYVVTLTVTNSNNLSDSATHSIQIASAPQSQQSQSVQPPHAAISGPSSGKVGKSVSFSAESSSVGAGSKKFNTVTWNFGDGGTASGAKVSHIYHKAGTYTVTLTVTNSSNLSNSTTHTVTIS